MSQFVNIDFEGFFDKKRVIDPKERAERRILSKAGAFVRRNGRSSLRKRKRSSAPGDPPSSHSGQLRRLLLFAYDTISSSVVIGPLLYRSARGSPTGTKTLPELMEFGGIVPGRRRTNSGRASDITRPVNYEARPFMGPALEKETPNFPELWRNQVYE